MGVNESENRPTDRATGGSPVSGATTLGAIGPPAFAVFALLGVAGLGLASFLGWNRGDNWSYLLHSYLVNYCFFLSISLGALFFVALQHVTHAGWSVTVRRLAELLAANMGCLVILFLPIVAAVFLGSGVLYPWADPNAAQSDELLAAKADYLQPAFFAVRGVLYFAVWGFSARFLLRQSLLQDCSGEVAPTLRMERLSPVVLLLFAITITFASFDWLMSLTPHWSSTIFGVYFFAGATVAVLAAIILLALLLQATGRLTTSITVEHYHDLGKLLFAFVIFWGYIAFSQYLLIWYANIPEETIWYVPRHEGAWGRISLVLLFGNLLLPFFGLLSRSTKRSKLSLGFWAAWLLVMHWIDLYWLVGPSYDPHHLPFGPIDVACLCGIGGIYLAALVRLAGDRALVPLADPRLEESLAFENT